MPQVQREKSDPHVGRPFVIAPGNPPEHKIVGEFPNGGKLRMGTVMQVWNDALLMDAVEGKGFHEHITRTSEGQFVMEIAELVYGLTFDEMLDAWLKIPKYTTPCIWKQGAKEWQC